MRLAGFLNDFTGGKQRSVGSYYLIVFAKISQTYNSIVFSNCTSQDPRLQGASFNRGFRLYHPVL